MPQKSLAGSPPSSPETTMVSGRWEGPPSQNSGAYGFGLGRAWLRAHMIWVQTLSIHSLGQTPPHEPLESPL